ncbi:MAG: T9SS type A sorting domain-containing protein, partial [Ignavibacteria bacterium]
FTFDLNKILSVGNSSLNADDYALEQNYPNPFNPRTVIRYNLKEQHNVVLKVFDALGREVRTLVNEQKSPGSHSVSFDGSGLSAGVYYYRLNAGEYSDVKKMLLVK